MTAELQKFISESTPHDIYQRYENLPEQARSQDFGEYDHNIIVIDTETTGVSLKKNELTQIAAARLEHGEIKEWFVTFVNPGHPIPDDISQLTHITDADVADAPTPEEAVADLVEFVGDAKLVAHNAAFDRNFVTKHPVGYPLLENEWIDSLELARIALPRMKSHRLIDLVKAFGAPLSTHRADADVAATCALYRILLAAVDAIPAPLIQQIAELATSTEWPTQRVFAFFAKRNLEEAVLHGQPLEQFSLKRMRQERVSKIDKKAKKDAGNMVSAELMANSSIHTRASQKTAKDLADPNADPAESPIQTIEFPSVAEIEDAFSPEGMVGRLYPDYETREEQLAMSLAVRNAFATSTNLMVEAGTGVGKSMAYLVPSALTALRNDITVGVATKTNALLDQLMFKELPALSGRLEETLGRPLSYAALKGFIHYPCLRKVQRIATDGAQMRLVQNEERSQAPAIAALLSFIEQTAYDDIDDLKIDYRVLPRRAITTTSNECLRRKCPFYGPACFVHGQRRIAESSDIVVTNHSLFFCDVAAEGSLLPPIRYWSVDEAHGAENEARRALSLEIPMDSLESMARRVRQTDTKANIFTRAERNVMLEPVGDIPQTDSQIEAALASESPGTLFHALLAKGRKAGNLFAEQASVFATQVRELLFFDPQKKSSYETFDLWINEEVRRSTIFQQLTEDARTLSEAADRLILVCQNLVAFLEDIEGAGQIQREIATEALELKDLFSALDSIFLTPSDLYVYSVTMSRKEDTTGSRPQRTCFHAMLFNVGSALDETLYVNSRSVVYTSATLTVANSFEPFELAMGLNTEGGSNPATRANALQLASCYDFDKNMTVYIVSDMPEPNHSHYLADLQQLLRETHIAQGGSMLTLFTNKKEMEACFSEVNPALKEEDLRLVCQKWGVSNKGLRDDFLSDETLSLFALKSFWEGFDAPGSTLRGVIIPKLPFASPNDPLSRERDLRDDSAWWRYMLPQAVLEIRQAVGRLIRKHDDSGVIILADSRLLTKRYGRTFISSLPTSDVRVLTATEICDELARS